MAYALLTDDRGKKFVWPMPPRRIVSLVPSDTYSLVRLGVGDRLVGRTRYCVEPAADVAAIALASGIALYGGTMLESALGTIASAQLFSTFRELRWGTELFGPLLLTEEILTQPLRYENFTLTLPQGPGLGVQLDLDKIERLRRDTKRGASVAAAHVCANRYGNIVFSTPSP